MRIYYIDRELDGCELAVVSKLMLDFGECAGTSVDQVRIPMVLPLPSVDGGFDMPMERQIELICGNLVRAGIEKDEGSQVVFVVPEETHWGVKFQEAIMEMTGFYPYVVQRCVPGCEGESPEGRVRIIDGHGLFGGKG